ncbi:unnamed protein product [Oncorhynchus mykiss]|uniref:FAM91 N-terminal domain-containing protein n=1 Tax=Oncorhynchus mykiss TaxID=8022 RepID=A0A060YML5_ONCMY|nr:unnamed protein product [Oncorhynchus mykiss]
MNTDVEFHIRQNYPWNKLPANVKQSVGNSQREYEKHVQLYSIRNQLRFRNNLGESAWEESAWEESAWEESAWEESAWEESGLSE